MVKKLIIPGGVEEYITKCPENVQAKLNEVRAAIQEVAPNAIETLSYFQFPGYCYQDEKYDYSGMFAWFSYKAPYIRLHVRPPVVQDFKNELEGCVLATGSVSFPEDNKIKTDLIKKMVLASIEVMKNKAGE